MTDDSLLTGPQVAGRLGISPGTWRGYVSRGRAPAPDDPDVGRPPNRRQPRWKTSTIDTWQTDRPGPGEGSTDLKDQPR